MTRYIILEIAKDSRPDEPLWVQVAEVEASSAEQAVRKYGGGIEGVRVAIPERSFKPLRVETTTITRTTLTPEKGTT